MKTRIKPDNDILTIIEQRGVSRFERCFKVCGTVLSLFELFMIISMIVSEKHDSIKTTYLVLYTFLLVICLALLILFWGTKKLNINKRTHIIKYAEIFFMIAIEAWAAGITYIDAISHQIIDLLVYISVLTLLPSIIFIRPAIGVPTQVLFHFFIYGFIFKLDFDFARSKYLFVNFTTYIIVSLIIYCLSYKIQYELYYREAELKKAAENDTLTELKNRFSYSTYIQMLKDHPENRDFAILLLDLNGLKKTNDTLGHSVGDELIQGAAWCIRKAFHKNGVCFRTGGDEFVVILNKRLTEIQPMLRNFESLCRNWKGETISSPSVSFGLAEALQETQLSVDELIQLADTRMYQMKNQYYLCNGINRRKNT